MSAGTKPSLLSALGAVADAGTVDELSHATIDCMDRVLGFDSAAMFLNQATGDVRIANWGWPETFFGPREAATFEALDRTEPWLLASHTRTGVNPALRISDFFSRRQFRALPIYGELFVGMGIEHQVAFTMRASSQGRFLCVALNRASGRDFSDREIERLEMLRRPLDALVLTTMSRLDAETDPARQALTGREVAVLELLSLGLSSRQIGRRLNTSDRTVDKHLEHIYAKCGMRSRAGAVAWWLGRGGPDAFHNHSGKTPGDGSAIRRST